MSGRVTLLGTKGGPAIRPGGPMPTSSLLELGRQAVVVDCGLGVTRSLVAQGFDLRTLGTVVITHLHSDHVLELGPLIHTAWTTGLRQPVAVYGPAGTSDYWQAFLRSMSFDNDIRVRDEGRAPLETLVTVTEYTEGPVFSGDLSMTALRVDHPPVTDCFALRFEGGGRAVTFSADTTYFPPLADFAKGSDILVHEAMLAEGVETLVAKTGLGEALRQHLMNSHALAEDAARIAKAAGVGHLVLHHLLPADDPSIGKADWLRATEAAGVPVTVGRDGMTIEID